MTNPSHPANIKPSYRSHEDNLLRDFYIPCLTQAVRYDRAAGYFTSEALSAAAAALPAFLEAEGKMRMVVSPHLSSEDIAAISAAYDTRDAILAERIELAIMRELSAAMPDAASDRLGCLGWLIKHGHLDIKIALVKTASGYGLYHEKFGIFSFGDDAQILFVGSANETAGGLITNFETVEVFQSSSQSDVERIEKRQREFDDLWEGRTRRLLVLDFPEAARRELVRRAPTERTGIAIPRDLLDDLSDESDDIPPVAGWGRPTIPRGREPRHYQVDAIRNWFNESGRGLLEMATGTGKTITAMSLTTKLYEALAGRDSNLLTVVICPYQHLVDQWAEEARSFGIRPVLCYRSASTWNRPLRGLMDALDNGTHDFGMAIVTNATLATDRFQRLLADRKGPLLVIGDEAHNLGSMIMRASLPDIAQYRLALSATPERWFDSEGTDAIRDYFGKTVFSLTLKEALANKWLTPYRYYPHLVQLTEEERDAYLEISEKIARLSSFSEDDVRGGSMSEQLERLLIARARLVASAENKLTALRDAMAPVRSEPHNLVYSGDGRVDDPASETGDVRQLHAITRLLGNDLDMSVSEYTSDTSLDERKSIRKRFAEGNLQVIAAIRCLDEGVDIPATRRAFIIASSSNPKQFIQRRGRVLRKSDGKDRADIHDFVVVPPTLDENASSFNTERNLLRKELSRVIEFASLAENGPEALEELLPLRKTYNLLDLG